MKIIAYLPILLFLTSCSPLQKVLISDMDVERIEVYKGYPGELVEMQQGFEKELVADLNRATRKSPTKFMKTHRILIYHTSGAIDTLLTNGKVHEFQGWHESQENLIEKYSR